MTWNHRVIRYADGTLGIHEVYYNKDGIVFGFTEDAVGPVGEDKVELLTVLRRMAECIDKPVLEYDIEYADGTLGIHEVYYGFVTGGGE